MERKLIIDVGMHKCEDTDFYLKRGYKVIGIDANIHLVDAAKEKYRKYIDEGQFVALNYAISDKDAEEVIFIEECISLL